MERADKTESKEELRGSQFKTKPSDCPDLLKAERDGTRKERSKKKKDKMLREARRETAPKTAPKSNAGSGGDG